MATGDVNRGISRAKHFLTIEGLERTAENAKDQRSQLKDFGYGRR